MPGRHEDAGDAPGREVIGQGYDSFDLAASVRPSVHSPGRLLSRANGSERLWLRSLNITYNDHSNGLSPQQVPPCTWPLAARALFWSSARAHAGAAQALPAYLFTVGSSDALGKRF